MPGALAVSSPWPHLVVIAVAVLLAPGTSASTSTSGPPTLDPDQSALGHRCAVGDGHLDPRARRPGCLLAAAVRCRQGGVQDRLHGDRPRCRRGRDGLLPAQPRPLPRVRPAHVLPRAPDAPGRALLRASAPAPVAGARKLLHRVVAVGGPAAIRELVEVLRRERYAGYEIVGACVPVGIPVDEDELTVPHLGAVEDPRRVCESSRRGHCARRPRRLRVLRGPASDRLGPRGLGHRPGRRTRPCTDVAGSAHPHAPRRRAAAAPRRGAAGRRGAGRPSGSSTSLAPPSVCCWSARCSSWSQRCSSSRTVGRSSSGRPGSARRVSPSAASSSARCSSTRTVEKPSSVAHSTTTARCSRSGTTRGSPGSGNASGGTPSTSCLSCSMSCSVT